MSVFSIWVFLMFDANTEVGREQPLVSHAVFSAVQVWQTYSVAASTHVNPNYFHRECVFAFILVLIPLMLL